MVQRSRVKGSFLREAPDGKKPRCIGRKFYAWKPVKGLLNPAVAIMVGRAGLVQHLSTARQKALNVGIWEIQFDQRGKGGTTWVNSIAF
jgi:hypothetical protein